MQVTIIENDVSSQDQSNARLFFKIHFENFDEFIKSYRDEVMGGSLFIQISEELKMGTEVELFCEFIDEGESFMGLGTVYSVKKGDSGRLYGIVIKLLNLDEKSTKLLAKLRRLLKGHVISN